VNPLPAGARRTTDAREVFRRLAKYHGMTAQLTSDRLHLLKEAHGRGPADNVVFDLTGNVFDSDTLAWLGSLTVGGAT
jgi:catalase (peroxidase I)